MKTLTRNAIIEGIILLLLAVPTARQLFSLLNNVAKYPKMATLLMNLSLPTLIPQLAIVIILAVCAISNVTKLARGPLSGVGVVHRTEEEDNNDNPVHGSRIDLESGDSINIRWNSSSPMATKVHDLPEGTRVKARWYPRHPFFGDILEDARPLDAPQSVTTPRGVPSPSPITTQHTPQTAQPATTRPASSGRIIPAPTVTPPASNSAPNATNQTSPNYVNPFDNGR